MNKVASQYAVSTPLRPARIARSTFNEINAIPFLSTTGGNDSGGQRVVMDRDRTQYLIDHATATHRALERGANVVGYLVWSLLDNFEWAEGCGPRFGIIRVDYDAQERTPKLSTHRLSHLCATGHPDPLRAVRCPGGSGWSPPAAI